MTSPIDRVVAILKSAGYEQRDHLNLRNIDFEFGAILVAPPGRSDLVVVIDATTETPKQIQDKVLTLSRALDVSRSRRPLTSILVGPIERESAIESIKRVCRVLFISRGNATADEDIKEQLAVLMPINSPPHAEMLASAMKELARELNEEVTPFVASLLERSALGREAVEYELLSTLQAKLTINTEASDQ